jgi:hypothetical protein
MAVNRKGLMLAALCLASASALAGVQVSAPAQAATGVAAGNAILSGADRRLILDGSSAEGVHALRLEDAQGKVVREVDLGAFLPASYVHALPRDGASLRWWRTAKLDAAAQQVWFRVPVPAAGANGPELEFSIDLRDGSVRTAQIREYLAAVDAARALDQQAVAAR